MENLSELEKIDKKLLKVKIIGSPGAILIGFSIYAIFSAKGDAFIPILNNLYITYSMLIIGSVICIWELKHIYTLSKLREKLQNDKVI